MSAAKRKECSERVYPATASPGATIRRTIHLAAGRRGARKVKDGPEPAPVDLPPPVSRQARLMAFAILFEEWLKEGKVKDYAELAQVTGFDRSRITRIMNLRLLESAAQELIIHATAIHSNRFAATNFD